MKPLTALNLVLSLGLAASGNRLVGCASFGLVVFAALLQRHLERVPLEVSLVLHAPVGRTARLQILGTVYKLIHRYGLDTETLGHLLVALGQELLSSSRDGSRLALIAAELGVPSESPSNKEESGR